MFISIDARSTPPTISLVEPDTFDRFAVLVAGQPNDETLRAALQRVGRPAGEDHVYVDAVALTALAGERAADPGWVERMDGMVAFARSKGWIDGDGGIRAHIERRDDESAGG